MRRNHGLLTSSCIFSCIFSSCILLLGTWALLTSGIANGQQILQYGFEAKGPVWKPGTTDTASKVLKHELTDETAHSGQRSEHIQLQVEKGSYINYTFDLPRAPVNDELNVSIYLKSNRPGIQLLCRVVLPQEKDPNNLTQPMTILVRCEPYQNTRWKLVTLRQPVKRLSEQQQLLTHQLGRQVSTAGAYIDQLVLNVYDGPGLTDVWIDDLEIGPVLENTTINPVPTAAAGTTSGPESSPLSRHGAEVQLRGNQLLVSGKRFLMLGIRYSGTPLKTLRDAGFNTIWLDEEAPPAIIEDAANLGFWIVPSIHPRPEVAAGSGRVNGQLTSAGVFGQKVSRFQNDAVLAWDLGSQLDAERFTKVTSFARDLRNADLPQPVIADVQDGYRGYSRSLDQIMLGTHRWPLMTSIEMVGYLAWLDQRRRLGVDNYNWTWIQTQPPEWYLRMLEDAGDKAADDEALGPQPEQIRLLAYLALAAGYRGLAFWSDRSLADSRQGRDRLFAMALLNQELRLLENILVQSNDTPDWIPTKNPNIMAAVFRTASGVLVLPIWVGPCTQYVTSQAATADVMVNVPGVPVTATAWEISPGHIQSYPIRREIGGTQVKLHNFSVATAVLFTSDLTPTGVVVRLQNEQRHMGPLAAQWLHSEAQEELSKVERVQAELASMRHTTPDAAALLDKARKSLELCLRHRRNGEHAEAYNQAEVAMRSLRTLMRAHWERAVRDLDTPSSSPYVISFFSLPRHWRLLDALKQMRPTPTVLPDGGFETPPDKLQPGWIVDEGASLDPVTTRVCRVVEGPHTGRQCAMIKISPRDPKLVPEVLERTRVTLNSPDVNLKPGTLVKISAWVRIPAPILASTDGAMIYDSIGGEELSVRLIFSTIWKRYTLYRKVPASGKVHVTLALTGIGTVYFDDVHIEPLQPVGTTATAPVAPISPGAAGNVAAGR